MEEAKVRLGGLFRSEDCPAPEELCFKFSFEAKLVPLPDVGDCSHQIVESAFDRWIPRSAVRRGNPSASAVAAIIRSAGSLG